MQQKYLTEHGLDSNIPSPQAVAWQVESSGKISFPPAGHRNLLTSHLHPSNNARGVGQGRRSPPLDEWWGKGKLIPFELSDCALDFGANIVIFLAAKDS